MSVRHKQTNRQTDSHPVTLLLNLKAVSCDEMFVDLTSLLNEFNMDPLLFVSLLRKQIKVNSFCVHFMIYNNMR